MLSLSEIGRKEVCVFDVGTDVAVVRQLPKVGAGEDADFVLSVRMVPKNGMY